MTFSTISRRNFHSASLVSFRSFANFAKMRRKRRHIRGLCGCDFVALNKRVSEFCGSRKIWGKWSGKAKVPAASRPAGAAGDAEQGVV
jgi:hypothetical protein